jgi:glycosyltransferase involved in cell wall biosynthesis
VKIVHVLSAFFPVIGGVDNYVRSLSKEMIRMGNEVTVITSGLGSGGRAREEEIFGISVKRLDYLFKIGGTPVIPGLYRELREINADVIHTHLPTPYTADIACHVARRRGIPCVLTYHNDITGRGVNKYIAAVYNRLVLPGTLGDADGIISTQAGYKERSPYLKKFENNITIIPCGVETDRFKPLASEKDENSIFFLSILNCYHAYKGLDYLLEALPRVKREISTVRLIIGGAGEWSGYYKRRAASLGLEQAVQFHGFIPDDKLMEYYNRCTVFVMPSTSSAQEGFGMVLLEALACGTPVITTDIAGVARDIKENKAGIIVPVKDARALAVAILDILKDKKKTGEMGQRGRKLVEAKYGWGRVGNEVIKLYNRVKR